MWAIFSRTLKDRRVTFLIYCLASIALLWMYIALFPAFKDQSASLEALMKNYPESFMKAFNFDIKSFTTIEGYLSTEQFSFVWPLMLMFLMIGYAGFAFSGEIEKGTIEILLAQPISRVKLFLSRFVVGVVMLILFVILSIFAAMPISKAYNINFAFENFLKLSLLASLFGLATYSIGIFLSSVFSDRGKVFFLSGGLLVLMYVLNIVSALKENLADLKYGSFFYYFNPTKALVYNQIDHWAYVVFGGVALVTFVLGLIVFVKRDIAA